MSKTVPALVNADLLAWARERAGYDLRSAAGKLKLPEERLRAWETGSERPTVAQARRLAELYKRPLAIFYLPERPQGFDVLREYRRMAADLVAAESPALRYALRMADFRRQVMLDLAEELREPLPRFEGQASPHEDAEEVGQRLRDYLGVTLERQFAWRSGSQALTEWRSVVEAKGALVFQISGVSVEEIRAGCIPKDPLPVVLLNSKDAETARVFSLMHELAHLWLLRGGHRVAEDEKARPLEEQPTEIFANAVAGAALVPGNAVLADAASFPPVRDAARGDLRGLKALAYRYSVSPEVLARRFAHLGRISAAEHRQIRSTLLAQGPVQPRARRELKIPIEVKVLSQLGRLFTTFVLNAYRGEALTGSRLSDYLGVKFKYVPKIEGELRNRIFGRTGEIGFA